MRDCMDRLSIQPPFFGIVSALDTDMYRRINSIAYRIFEPIRPDDARSDQIHRGPKHLT